MIKNQTYSNLSEQNSLSLSAIVHEIRNPLALISCEMQLMASEHPELSSDERWNRVTENFDYIRDLLSDLTEYQNSMRINAELIDITPVLYSISEAFLPVFAYQNIHFETEIAENLPLLMIDAVKIRQVIFNLLKNARESICHDHGMIRLCASSNRENVKITISDNGCGMNKKQKDEVFRPFVTYKSTGTGLGLPISAQIAKSHGGSIAVHSVCGSGSSFFLYLPIPKRRNVLRQNLLDLRPEEDIPRPAPASGR